jgi:hypothetical protein
MAKDKDTKIDGGFRDHQCGEAAAEKTCRETSRQTC